MNLRNARATTVAAAALALAVALAFPARAATVTVAPFDTTVTIGDMVTVRLMVSAEPDIKGAQAVYRYTSPRLQFMGAAAGDVFTQGGGAYFDFVIPDVAPPDSVWYDVARLTSTSAGPGILAFFTFQAMSEGDAFLTCERVELRDSQNQPTLPVCSGATIHVVGPVPVRPETWGRLKALYR